jgi:hypothetical protein
MNERILARFAEADISLIAMAEALSRSTDYRVLRRLVHRATLTWRPRRARP